MQKGSDCFRSCHGRSIGCEMVSPSGKVKDLQLHNMIVKPDAAVTEQWTT